MFAWHLVTFIEGNSATLCDCIFVTMCRWILFVTICRWALFVTICRWSSVIALVGLSDSERWPFRFWEHVLGRRRRLDAGWLEPNGKTFAPSRYYYYYILKRFKRISKCCAPIPPQCHYLVSWAQYAFRFVLTMIVDCMCAEHLVAFIEGKFATLCAGDFLVHT